MHPNLNMWGFVLFPIGHTPWLGQCRHAVVTSFSWKSGFRVVVYRTQSCLPHTWPDWAAWLNVCNKISLRGFTELHQLAHTDGWEIKSSAKLQLPEVLTFVPPGKPSSLHSEQLPTENKYKLQTFVAGIHEENLTETHILINACFTNLTSCW